MARALQLDPRVRHQFIRTGLSLRHQTLSSIATAMDVTTTTVSLVSQGKTRSAKIEQALATAIGFELHELWPERYHDALEIGGCHDLAA
jgi:Ner family transcriptional regulator